MILDRTARRVRWRRVAGAGGFQPVAGLLSLDASSRCCERCSRLIAASARSVNADSHHTTSMPRHGVSFLRLAVSKFDRPEWRVAERPFRYPAGSWREASAAHATTWMDSR